jgi:hypothetical protein
MERHIRDRSGDHNRSFRHHLFYEEKIGFSSHLGGDFKLIHSSNLTRLAIALSNGYRSQFTSEGVKIVRDPSTAPRQARFAQDDSLRK